MRWGKDLHPQTSMLRLIKKWAVINLYDDLRIRRGTIANPGKIVVETQLLSATGVFPMTNAGLADALEYAKDISWRRFRSDGSPRPLKIKAQ